ncbi:MULTISPECIES: co-chaperone GroES [unclassified Roseiflexus]|jgi:chaperonin GroES|uniref:co-chaperone GroES n=1 Tax=unclassified Roseiflexus TaxID=2609473 RepID=UPI0000D7F83B|nr:MULTISPECIES: co-chaperone GroES [unclassified Roseiflexus]ABQ89485.1 chaperonin Cpn10 [Roseiflexus sp. RS-1]MBO9323021.1 co-chaperone GroES [Roseiflexus sp.]MCL6541295.1 co-chaperone GroES [Roseiflexus sp.]
MHVRPLGDRVVVKPKPREEKTKGGVILPDTASKERPMQGEVIAVGPGRHTDDGKLIPISVEVGQQVLFAKYAGTEFKIDDEEYLILQERDLLGIIQEE